MKRFFLIFSFFLSASALANGIIFWKEVSREQERATTKAEFLALQQKYPQEFGGYDPERVESASITIYQYELQGDTVCAKDDPRARFRAVSSSVCISGINGGPGLCSASALPFPGLVEKDPCAE